MVFFLSLLKPPFYNVAQLQTSFIYKNIRIHTVADILVQAAFPLCLLNTFSPPAAARPSKNAVGK